MKGIICSIIICLFTGFVYAQVPCSKGEKAGIVMQFGADIKNNTLKIYTLGGLKPYNQETTQAFEKRYNVTYHDFGCLAPGSMDFYNAYNLLVFKYFNEKYGNEWEKDIKDNAMGFYKRTHAK